MSSLRSPWRPVAAVRRRVTGCALLGLLSLGAATGPMAHAAERPVRIGFMASIFKNRNESDVLAAVRVWAETISKERNIEVDPRMTIARSLEQAIGDVREERVDGLTLSLEEYAAFPAGLLGGPFFRDQVSGSILVEYALVAAKDGRVQGVGDVKDARIVVHDGVDAGVAQAWLEAQLAASGLGRLAIAAASLERKEKPSACVLSVFFGQADACLVRRSVFEGTAELNPQVGRRLAIAAASEPIAPSLFCFRATLPRESGERLHREAVRLHESVTGQQVLRVFKSDRMKTLTAEEVERSVLMLSGWRRAVGGSQ